MRTHINRAFSILVAAIYLASAYFSSGPETTWKVGLFLILPLACIWFSEAMGDFTGSTQSVAITCPTPGWMVLVGGWIVLFLPVIMWLVALSMTPNN